MASASTDEGVLRLVFTDGATLRSDPSDEYEAWQVVGGRPQGLVVCCPGGEIAVWDERTPSAPVSELAEIDQAAASSLDEMLKRFGMPPPGSPASDADKP